MDIRIFSYKNLGSDCYQKTHRIYKLPSQAKGTVAENGLLWCLFKLYEKI